MGEEEVTTVTIETTTQEIITQETTSMMVEPTEKNSSEVLKRSLEGTENNSEAEKQKVDVENKEPVCIELGPKRFGSSVEMFDYFFKLIHHWPPYLSINKYEHMVLLELLNKGHPDREKKIGEGVHAFQVRYHPEWKSKCFFIIRSDESAEDFSFRKCVDQILPLPENMQIKQDVNKVLGRRKFGHGGKGRGGDRDNFHGGRG